MNKAYRPLIVASCVSALTLGAPAAAQQTESAEPVGIGYDKLIARIVNLGLSYEPEWRLYE